MFRISSSDKETLATGGMTCNPSSIFRFNDDSNGGGVVVIRGALNAAKNSWLKISFLGRGTPLFKPIPAIALICPLSPSANPGCSTLDWSLVSLASSSSLKRSQLRSESTAWEREQTTGWNVSKER